MGCGIPDFGESGARVSAYNLTSQAVIPRSAQLVDDSSSCRRGVAVGSAAEGTEIEPLWLVEEVHGWYLVAVFTSIEQDLEST